MSAWLADHCCIADSLARCAFAVARWAASRSLRRAWSAAEDDDEAPGEASRGAPHSTSSARRDSRSVAVAEDTASVAAERMAASSAWARASPAEGRSAPLRIVISSERTPPAAFVAAASTAERAVAAAAPLPPQR